MIQHQLLYHGKVKKIDVLNIAKTSIIIAEIDILKTIWDYPPPPPKQKMIKNFTN